MARTDFGPEVKASMEGNANTPRRPPQPRGPVNPGSQVRGQEADSSGNNPNPPIQPRPVGPGAGRMPNMGRMPGGPVVAPNVPPGLHDTAAAAGIAHAILG